MNDMPEDQFDTLLRDRLRAAPVPPPICDLTKRATSLALSRQAVTSARSLHRRQPRYSRIMTVSTALAMLVIAGILLMGTWLLLTRDVFFSASSIATSSNGQSDGFGFTLAVLAGLVVILGIAARSFLDSIDSQIAL